MGKHVSMKEKGLREKSGIFGPGATALTNSVDFSLLGPGLNEDVEMALKAAIASGALFPKETQPILIFREVLAAAIRNIESHPRGRLFQEFLWKGPYEDGDEIPPELKGKRLSDEETASVITFIYSHMANCFKGAVTELLAAGACTRLLRKLQVDGEVPADARLYIGDAVTVRQKRKAGLLKGADMHILVEDLSSGTTPTVIVAGLAEVKSYFQTSKKLRDQLRQHLKRIKNGLRVSDRDYPPDRVRVGVGPRLRVLRIAVLPDNWVLRRTFHFSKTEHGQLLHVDPTTPPRKDDGITNISRDEWLITLRWSKEALAAAAYEMTFWYMEKVGEVVFSRGAPSYWKEMNPAEAGRNAAKASLYYAMLHCRTARENQRAIALYNTYGFGYALGMNFRNSKGKREMLWPQDLDEILVSGRTKEGSGIWG
jgi:hypothetical protein